MSSTKAIPQSSILARKPPRQPLLWAALAYGTGIVAGTYAWRPPLWWVVAALGFLAAGIYFARRRVWFAFALALGALFFLGALAIQLSSQGALDNGILTFADGEEVLVTGHVMHEGEIREAGFGGWRQSVDVETEELTRGASTVTVRDGVRVSVYAKESAQEYEGLSCPSAVFAMRNECGSWPSCEHHEIFATPVRLTIADTWRTTASSRWLRPRARRWTCFQDSWVTASSSCGRMFIAASFERSMRFGPQKMPRSWTPRW